MKKKSRLCVPKNKFPLEIVVKINFPTARLRTWPSLKIKWLMPNMPMSFYNLRCIFYTLYTLKYIYCQSVNP